MNDTIPITLEKVNAIMDELKANIPNPDECTRSLDCKLAACLCILGRMVSEVAKAVPNHV